MTWCGIHGHDQVLELFRQSLKQGRMASTFLFVGPSGIGKRLFAIRLAQSLLCERRPEIDLNPCLACDSCCQVDALSHPDVEMVNKPADKASIPIDLFIGDREHRNQQGLCHRISLKPARGRRRFAIIDDADYLNAESANCLLKTLEEPPPHSVLILIGTSQQRQLPTIRSRCQVVRFRALSDDFVREHLIDRGAVSSVEVAAEVAGLAEGSLDLALEFAAADRIEFRTELWTLLGGSGDLNTQSLAKTVTDFVDSAGKEAPKRREQLRHVIRLFMLFYRRRIFRETGSPAGSADDAVEQQARRLDRCLQALREVDANANLATLIECWVDDLYGSLTVDRLSTV